MTGDWLWTWGNKYHLGYPKKHYLGLFFSALFLGAGLFDFVQPPYQCAHGVLGLWYVWPLKIEKTENDVSGKSRRCEQKLACAKVKIEVESQTVWILSEKVCWCFGLYVSVIFFITAATWKEKISEHHLTWSMRDDRIIFFWNCNFRNFWVSLNHS